MQRNRLLYSLATLAMLVSLLSASPAASDSPLPPRTGLGAIPAGEIAPDALPQAAAWYNGMIEYSQIMNCVSIIQGFPYMENGVGTFVGFVADPDAGQPGVNDVYYVHVYIAALGVSCSGQRAIVEIVLPPNTSLAIDGTNKVFCFYDNVPISPASECPQTLPPSTINLGAYWIPSIDTAHARSWPMPTGHTLEIRIPVRSATTLTNETFQANVWMLDGNTSPWLYPRQGVFVFSSNPSILYPSPSTINVTAATAQSQAYLYTHGIGGDGYFDLGYSAGSYSLEHEFLAIPAGGNSFTAYDDWTPASLGGHLQPDTLYHWRFTFFPTSGSPVYGTDQAFRTLPDGVATVGNGQPASCTEEALNAALAGSKLIRFDCGLSFVTIPLTSQKTIASGVTISGSNLVTLDGGGASRLFSVQAGGHLTLTQITLAHGRVTSYLQCGGAVTVASGGSLATSQASFISNASSEQGGAVCVAGGGTADIRSTLFMSNTAASHGGAIGNYGVSVVASSQFNNNTASINGGGVDSTGTLTVTNTSFNANTAGFRGGGINNYVGKLSVGDSSFSGNSAGWYGGAVSNDGSTATATVQNSSVSGNTAGTGGGLQSSGTLILRNSTVSGNHAVYVSGGNGGGVLWMTPGTISMVNDTIAGNTAVGQGGNIYVGGSYNNLITPWNTLVASGAPNNCDAAVWSRGYNLESTNTCGFSTTGDLRNTNPRLGPLQNNGGSSLTHALLPGSPAINAANNAVCPPTDQRGTPRPQAGICDIGAYEYRPEIFLPYVRR